MAGTVVNVARRVAKVIGWALLYLAIWLGIFTLFAGIGILVVYGPTPVDQVLFNVFPIELNGGGGAIVWIGILVLGVLPILLTAAIAWWQIHRTRKRRRNGADLRPRRARWITRTVSTALVGALVAGGATVFSSTVNLPEYVQAATSSYSVDQYYKAPEVTLPKGSKKKNLVLIYLESGEGTLSDTSLFEKDPFVSLKESTKAEDGWKSIDDFKQFEGGGWTMAGVTSTSCGIPLKSNGLLAGKSGLNEVGGVSSYLSGISCVGDVLKDQGYKNVFMGGANASFASKDVFLKTHGYDEEYDLKTWQEQGDEPEDQFRPDWGLSDERLMHHAKEKVDELHAESKKGDQPFNLSMLTLDTHEPPHVYPDCDVDTDNELLSVYACSNQHVADFVDHMKKKGYLKDTAVVLMGDHYKHMNPSYSFHEELDDNPDRYIFNRIWVPGDEKNKLKTRPGIDQLNLFPTILEATGFKVKNREAGLGVSAFAPESQIPSGSAQALETKKYEELLNAHSSDFYKKAWGDESALDKGTKIDKNVKLDRDSDDDGEDSTEDSEQEDAAASK